MILAFDSYYFGTNAHTVCIAFQQWKSAEISWTRSDVAESKNVYVSGQFYKRELPGMLNLLSQVDLSEIECIIVDGFVYLDDDYRKGLGAYLYDALDSRIPVVGVAKTAFGNIRELKRDIRRGISQRPLYITSAGMAVDDAAARIRNMAGKFRIPDLLKQLDQLSGKIPH